MLSNEAKIELERIAKVIFNDLGICGDVTFLHCWNILYDHGACIHVLPDLKRQHAGLIAYDCDTECAVISLSGHLTLYEATGVLIHELAHKIIWSHKYADLNNEARHLFESDEFTASEWQEHLARTVERVFIERGGPCVRPISELSDTMPKVAMFAATY